MISPKELRIGNTIYLELGLPGLNVHMVRGQDIADIEQGRITLSAMSGIPLTPELLGRCGFGNGGSHDGGNSSWNHSVFPFGLTDNGSPGYSVYYYNDSDCIYPSGLDHLHQLQNLYFALTGEELQIK